jgi:hypothetical protein
MRKLNSLRAHLAAALPELARNPEALMIFAEGGTLAVRDGTTLGFEMRYTAVLTFLDCQYAPAQIFLPLVIWLRDNQRDVLQNHQSGTEQIRFKVDPADLHAVDLDITLPLTEALDVLPNGDGGYDMDWRAEPPVYGLEELADPAALLRQLWGQCRDMPADFWTGHDAPLSDAGTDQNAGQDNP